MTDPNQSVRKGARVDPPKFPGPKWAKLVSRILTAILNCKIVIGDRFDVVFSDSNWVIQLDKTQLGSSGSGSSGGVVVGAGAAELVIATVFDDYVACTGIYIVTGTSIAAGGSGYVDGSLITFPGTGISAVGQISVTAGAIVSVMLLTGGQYTASPTTPSTPVGGGGTGASINLTVSGTVNVAKQAFARVHTTPVSDTINGVTYSYDYSAYANDTENRSNHRVVTDGVNPSENQVMLRTFHAGDKLVAMPCATLTVESTACSFMDMTTMRSWVKV